MEHSIRGMDILVGATKGRVRPEKRWICGAIGTGLLCRIWQEHGSNSRRSRLSVQYRRHLRGRRFSG